MFIYVGLALIAITAIIVLANLFIGLARGFKKTIGSLAAIIISAVIAFILTIFLCAPQSSLMTWAMDTVKGILTQPEIQEILNIGEVGEAIAYYAAMLVAPIFFALVFIVISIIVTIIAAIVIRFIPPFNLKKGHLHRFGGLGVGVVCGLLVSLFVLMPVAGLIGIVAQVGESGIIESDNEDDMFAQLLKEASEDEISAVYVICTGWLFDSLASAEYDGEKIYLKDEITVILSLVSNLSDMSGESNEISDKQIEALNSILDDVDHSPILNNTIAGVLSTMATKWNAGEAFLGIESISAGEMIDPIIDSMLEVMATSDKTTVVGDMRTLVNALEVMVDYDIISNADNMDKMVEILSAKPENEGDKTAIEALICVVNENPRMSKLPDEITRLSIRALSSNLGIPENGDDRYNMLMDDFAIILNESKDAYDKVLFVEERSVSALNAFGVEISDDSAMNIAEAMVADLGDIDNVTSDAVKEFFMMYAVASDAAEAAGNESSEFDKLEEEDMEITIDPSTGVIKIGDYEFKYYNASSYVSSSAYSAGSHGVDFGGAKTLYSAETMESKLITLDDIFNSEGVKLFGDLSAEEAAEEAKLLSEMLSTAIDVFGGDLNNIDYKAAIKNMGAVFDRMSEMQTLGHDATANLVKALFQSEQIKDALGLPADEFDGYAQTITNAAQKENNSYQDITASVGGMIDMMDKVKDENATKEEKIEATKDLMQNLTPENAEVISTMTTPEMMKDYVSDEKKAESVSNSVSSLFTNMADYNTENEEEYVKEAEAVNTILNLAMEGSSSTNDSIFTQKDEAGEVVSQGKLDTDAAGFVDLIVNSDVVSKTVEETVNSEDENPLGIVPSEEDKTVLTDALTGHYDNAKEELGDEELAALKAKLENIAKLANIEIPTFE